MQENKENEVGTHNSVEQVEGPPGMISKKRRGKYALVDTEVRRSDRIRNNNEGFKSKPCPDFNCLPCNASPPELQNKVVKNLSASFCKVGDKELEIKLSKRPKKKAKEEVAKVPKAKGKKANTNSSP